jgi:hypothetical protein
MTFRSITQLLGCAHSIDALQSLDLTDGIELSALRLTLTRVHSPFQSRMMTALRSPTPLRQQPLGKMSCGVLSV